MNDSPSHRFVLRDLPFAPRLVLALFLVSVGVGYFSALVQMHFQDASPGQPLPTRADVENIFSGPKDRPLSKVEQLLEADEAKPFNGQGQMRAAFTRKSEDFKDVVSSMSHELKLSRNQAEEKVHQLREGERQALLAWVRSGASKEAFNKDNFPLPPELAGQPLTEDYKADNKEQPAVKIRTLLTDRCFRCHKADGDVPDFPLNSYALLKPYVQVKESSGMSLPKLAQTTHVHLLGFSILYSLTGLIFAFSSYPGWVRVLLAPLALLAQLADISCWWLARVDRMYADVILITGAVVATALFLQILLSLFNLFGRLGKTFLILLIVGTSLGGYMAKDRIIAPFLEKEKANVAADKGE